MKFTKTYISNLLIIDLDLIKDNRGWFSRSFCENEFKKIGFNERFVQHNHSFNKYKGTMRGMHFQLEPQNEAKMIRCISGKVFDVAVDLRKGSSTFLKWFGIELSEFNKKMIFIPRGFGHGFLTLEDKSELIYYHSESYNKDLDSGFSFLDPLVNIKWPNRIKIISEKDRNLPNIPTNFIGL